MSHRRTFFATFALVLVATLLASGLLLADVNTRRVTFEDSTPPYAAHPPQGTSVPLPVGGEALRLVYQGEKAVLNFLLNALNVA